MEKLCRGSSLVSCRYEAMAMRSILLRQGYRRTISTTTCLQAVKASKPKKAVSRPSQYRSPVPRTDHKQKLAENKSSDYRYRRIPLIAGGTVLFFLSTAIGYLFVSMNKHSSSTTISASSLQRDVSSRYDTIASTFDSTIESSEYWLGMQSLRKKLASLAHGDVLEVSIGTGRNLEFYDWNFKGFNGVGRPDSRGDIKRGKIRSFTAVDKSAEMLEVAHEKFGKLYPGILGVRWVIADAAEEGAIPGPPRSADERSGNLDRRYDTVVQTMGLCSVSDPTGLLKNLGECVKEEEGRILLLEHGRGRWKWLNNALDQSAEAHANSFGCWWNRDLRTIVEESGLEVVKIETPKWWHGGTTWWIELKKPKAR